MEFKNSNMVSINSLIKHKVNNFIVKFPRVSWYLHLNKTFKENVKDVENGNTEHYLSTSNVPLFTIHRDARKIGYAFPRETKESKQKFLFIPKTNNKMYMSRKGVSKPYYIFDVDGDHIPKYKARLMFLQRSRLY